MILSENRRLSRTSLSVQITNKQGGQSNKISAKAHLDTLRRRERYQRSRAALLEECKDLGCLNDNRFILLFETDEEEEVNDYSEVDTLIKNKIKTMNKSNSRNKNAKKSRGMNQREVLATSSDTEQEYLTLSESENDQGNESTKPMKDKRRIKTYLQGYKILAYLKGRILDERSSKSKQDLKDAFNEVCSYALNTIGGI